MGGVIRNRRLVREKPESGLISDFYLQDFLGWGWKVLLPNDANVLILSGLCISPARWTLITRRTYGQACSSNYLASVTQSGSAR